jgi:hypothetical protein
MIKSRRRRLLGHAVCIRKKINAYRILENQKIGDLLYIYIQFNSWNGPVKVKCAYLCTSG